MVIYRYIFVMVKQVQSLATDAKLVEHLTLRFTNPWNTQVETLPGERT